MAKPNQSGNSNSDFEYPRMFELSVYEIKASDFPDGTRLKFLEEDGTSRTAVLFLDQFVRIDKVSGATHRTRIELSNGSVVIAEIPIDTLLSAIYNLRSDDIEIRAGRHHEDDKKRSVKRPHFADDAFAEERIDDFAD